MVKHYQGDDGDLTLLMGAIPRAFESLSIDDYSSKVSDFFSKARHPTLGRAYRQCGYTPMVELLRYLEAHGFTTYIASGGDRDFMRPIAGEIHDIPPERIIRSSFALDYREGEEGTDVIYKVGGAGDMTEFSLRVTTIHRKEDGRWRIVHRHADPITSPRPADSLTQK